MKISKFCMVLFFTTALYQTSLAQRKNVLFIMVDDLNDYIGAMKGHPQTLTPNLDKLAQRSIVFQNAHCSSPICVPSRTALLTGRRPHELGITNTKDGYFREPIKPLWMQNLVTLPQYFKQKGYETVTVGKIFHFTISSRQKDNAMENEEWDDMDIMDGNFSNEKAQAISKDPISWTIQGSADGKETTINYYKVPNTEIEYSPTSNKIEDSPDWQRANYCVKYLRQSHTKPFFLACGISRPHLPFFAPKAFYDKFNLNTIKLPPYLANDFNDIRKNFSWRNLNAVQKVNKWKDIVRAYLASIAYADACVGYLLNELEKSAYKNNTLIILMGDHGYHLGEKNHIGKHTLWERALKTPLIIYDPSLKTKGNCQKVVSLQDIYPTLVELCGLPKPNFIVRGRSLKRLIVNPLADWDGAALASFTQYTTNPDSHSFRSNRYHYIWYYNGDEELYDMQNDPNEWTNLAYNASHTTIKNQMKNAMRTMLAGDDNPFDKSNVNNIDFQKEVEDFEEGKLFRLYPNPASSFTNIQWFLPEKTDINISITDIYGKEIQNFNINAPTGQIDYLLNLRGLQKGIYFVYFNTSQRKKIYKKLIIE